MIKFKSNKLYKPLTRSLLLGKDCYSLLILSAGTRRRVTAGRRHHLENCQVRREQKGQRLKDCATWSWKVEKYGARQITQLPRQQKTDNAKSTYVYGIQTVSKIKPQVARYIEAPVCSAMKSRIHDWWQARRASCKLLQPIEKLDGLWAWVVCFASFGLFFCGAGVLYTFGVLYIGLLDYFADIKEMANVNQSCCTENSTQNRDLSAELGLR